MGCAKVGRERQEHGLAGALLEGGKMDLQVIERMAGRDII